ncbi:hypothetical protein [Floridanema aerugineum]|uniref:Uncharacterized protein n=1 Tax=Floridaenema aerugineum BLCC-F46 TaxID=3153654 RepID=A0ABV4X3N6_9CYAN
MMRVEAIALAQELERSLFTKEKNPHYIQLTKCSVTEITIQIFYRVYATFRLANCYWV